MSNAFDKLSVLDSFIEEVNSYLPEIESNLERLAQSPGDIDALEETYRRTHTIGGSASMMDFPGLAHVAHGMEDILGDVLDGLATLDAPTISLLQRSLGRMHQLLRGIHQGIDENAIIAEDDADYTQYRFMMASQAQGQRQGAFGEQTHLSHEQPLPQSPMPSLDDMLASFRTPMIAAGEEVAWPEDPVPTASFEIHSDQEVYPGPAKTPEPEYQQSEQNSALDTLMATTTPRLQANSVPPPTLPATPTRPLPATGEAPSNVEAQILSEDRQGELTPANAGEQDTSFSTVYNRMQEETRALETQAASFKGMLTQLRQAVSIVEAQRTK